eukprot:NODE_100_length_20777_cov_0.240884.p25 type:complete len:103 gc:universal NODE_100_length_20777_cov_0.240884:17371-17679(+)
MRCFLSKYSVCQTCSLLRSFSGTSAVFISSLTSTLTSFSFSSSAKSCSTVLFSFVVSSNTRSTRSSLRPCKGRLCVSNIFFNSVTLNFLIVSIGYREKVKQT